MTGPGFGVILRKAKDLFSAYTFRDIPFWLLRSFLFRLWISFLRSSGEPFSSSCTIVSMTLSRHRSTVSFSPAGFRASLEVLILLNPFISARCRAA